MTSKEESKSSSAEERRRSPLDHLPPPANSNKPLTPFSIEDILSKTFKGLEVSVLQAAEGRDGMTIFGQRQTPKKRRKSRTAFTNHQIYELEKRFLYQKYLSPADRDQIAQQLGLTNAQVITWFQNRRAKLKRDLEEMKADVESTKKLSPSSVESIISISELEQQSDGSVGKSRSSSPALLGHLESGAHLQLSPSSPRSSSKDDDCCSDDEDDDVEIDVDD